MSATLADRDRLRARLEDGDRLIAAAELAGKDVAYLEDFWLTLLGQYEAVCRALDVISPPAPDGDIGMAV